MTWGKLDKGWNPSVQCQKHWSTWPLLLGHCLSVMISWKRFQGQGQERDSKISHQLRRKMKNQTWSMESKQGDTQPRKSRIRSKIVESMRWSVHLKLSGASASPGGLLKQVVLGSTSSISTSVGLDGTWKFAFLTSSKEMMLMVLVWGPHLETGCSRWIPEINASACSDCSWAPGTLYWVSWVCLKGWGQNRQR